VPKYSLGHSESVKVSVSFVAGISVRSLIDSRGNEGGMPSALWFL
jgi:hypothetical protein